MNEADGLIARKGAILVKWGFEQYRSGFRRLTRRSALHFESADWHGVQQDMVERLALYTNVVRRVVAALEEVFGEARRSPDLWSAMKREYSWLMGGHGDLELAETFFNSVTRKVFTTVGVDAKREFVHFGSDTGLPPPGRRAREDLSRRPLDLLRRPPDPRRLRVRNPVGRHRG